jgi:hypothetical protein
MPAWLIPAALGLRAATSIFEGIGQAQQARAEQRQAETNAFIGRTRARQGDAFDRRALSDELATMRNAFAANGQSGGVGTFEMLQELRDVRNRERGINFNNRMMEAYDFDAAGRQAGQRATWGFLGGVARAGQSLFSLYDYSQGGIG